MIYAFQILSIRHNLIFIVLLFDFEICCLQRIRNVVGVSPLIHDHLLTRLALLEHVIVERYNYFLCIILLALLFLLQ